MIRRMEARDKEPVPDFCRAGDGRVIYAKYFR